MKNWGTLENRIVYFNTLCSKSAVIFCSASWLLA